MTLLKFKETDVKNVVISKPEKVDGIYKSQILYVDEPFLIQTPELEFDENCCKFNMVNNGQFFSLLDDLTEHIIQYIYTHSKEFFNGKEFSENRIRTSLKKIVQVDNEGNIEFQAKSLHDLKVMNIFNEEIINYTFPLKGKFIVEFAEIHYEKKEFIVSIPIKYIKLSPKKLKKEDDIFLEDVEVVEESETKEPIVQELETIVENVDDLEFF
jgi:hypothetical protein